MSAILYLGYHGNGHHFEFVQPPQKLPHTTVDIPTKWIIIWVPNHGYQFPTSKSTWKPTFAQIGGFLYFGGHFGFKMAAIENQRWISIIRNIIIYLQTKFRPNRRIFLFWIQNGRQSKPTMNINSHHHNLLGNQISLISEDFCIWRPFCTLVTMATPQKLPHTTVDIPTKFHEV